MNKDPVCGSPVDATLTQYVSEFEGQTYYFCSAACQERFDQDPVRYARSRAA